MIGGLAICYTSASNHAVRGSRGSREHACSPANPCTSEHIYVNILSNRCYKQCHVEHIHIYTHTRPRERHHGEYLQLLDTNVAFTAGTCAACCIAIHSVTCVCATSTGTLRDLCVGPAVSYVWYVTCRNTRYGSHMAGAML